MRLGIGSYAFAWSIGVPGHPPPRPMTAFDLLEEAHRLGVRVVQLCDNLPLTSLASAELDRFEQRSRELGLLIELGTRGLDIENVRTHLRLCQRFNSPFLRLVIDSAGDEPPADEAVDRLRPIVKELAAGGIRLAIENHDRFRSGTLAWMIEQLGREHAGICLDTVNSFGALEGPDVVVQNLGEFTLCLHVKDFRIHRVSHKMGFVLEGCPAGNGQLNVPWLLNQLSRSPNPFNVILESWVAPGNALDETIARERLWADKGIRYLRTLVPD